ETVLTLDLQPNHRRLYVVKGVAFVEKADERPQRSGRIIVLGLAKQQRGAALDVPQVDVVAERRPDDSPCARRDHGYLRLGIVPAGDRMQPDIGAETDCGHRLAFGEYLGVRADADLE